MGKKECEVKKVLEEKKDAEYRKYDGTVHGFAARPQKSDPVVQRTFPVHPPLSSDFLTSEELDVVSFRLADLVSIDSRFRSSIPANCRLVQEASLSLSRQF